MNIHAILGVLLPLHISDSAIECVNRFIRPLTRFPVLIAVEQENYAFILPKLSVPSWIIDNRFDKHFSVTGIRVDAAVIFLGCRQRNSTILWTIKKNRLISVRMKLLLVVDVRCRPQITPKDYLHEIQAILGPAVAAVVSLDGIREDFHWSWSHGLQTHVSHTGIIKSDECAVGLPTSRDFRGMDLKVAAVFQDPYVREPGTNGKFESGVEVEIIRTVASAMGVKINWVKLPDGESPRVLKNARGEYNGMFGALYRFEADVTFGGIVYQIGRFHGGELLTSHTEDQHAWLIPAPPKANNWNAVFSVFSPTTWCLIVSSVILFVTVFSLSDNLSGFPPRLLLAIGILLDQGPSVQSHGHASFWVLFVVYCLILTNAYRSSLITALTSETPGPWYETPEQAVEAGETTWFFPSGLALFRETATYDPVWRTILQPGRHRYLDNLTPLRNISESRHGIVLCIRFPCLFTVYRHGLFNSNLKPKLTFLEKRFARFPVAMFMAPGSALHPAVELRTNWLLEAGLTDFWFHDMEWRARLATFLTITYKKDGPQKLSMNHLQLTFFIYSALVAASVLVFLIEVARFYRTKTKLTSFKLNTF